MPASRLTPNQKCEIVKLKGKQSSAELAAKYEVVESTIRMIWKNAHAAGDAPAVKQEAFGKRVSVLTGFFIMPPQMAKADVVIPDEEPTVIGGKVLDGLEPCDCRWIIGKDIDGDTRYCGQPQWGALAGATKMYCVEHAMRAVRSPIHEDDGRRVMRPRYGSAAVVKYHPPVDLEEAA